MANRIVDVQIEDRSLDPASVEVWITIRSEDLTPTTELRGKLMGPSCPYATTIEIAYPFQPLRRVEISDPGTLRSRVVIPEASLWDPQSPFVYHGILELWQDGERCERRTLHHALRKFHLGATGLRVNSKAIRLEGRTTDRLDEALASQWRKEGVNLLLVPLRQDTLSIWDEAERLGFFVIGRMNNREEGEARIGDIQARASYFGWVWGDSSLESNTGISLASERTGYRIEWRNQDLGRIA